jgi:hypothetical protein
MRGRIHAVYRCSLRSTCGSTGDVPRATYLGQRRLCRASNAPSMGNRLTHDIATLGISVGRERGGLTAPALAELYALPGLRGPFGLAVYPAGGGLRSSTCLAGCDVPISRGLADVKLIPWLVPTACAALTPVFVDTQPSVVTPGVPSVCRLSAATCAQTGLVVGIRKLFHDELPREFDFRQS